MNAPGRRLFGWAMLGFAIAAVFVSYQLLTDTQSSISRSPTLMLAFVALCPPSLLSVALDPDVGTGSFYLLWTVIALLNAGLFTTVRALLTRRLQRPD